MTRKVRAVAIAMTIGILAVATAFVILQPRWTTASQAEVDRILGPELAAVPQADDSEIRRGQALWKALNEIDLEIVGPASGPKKNHYGHNVAAEWLSRNGARLGALRSIVEGGPYSETGASAFAPDDAGGAMRARMSVVVRQLAATGQSTSGEAAGEALAIGQLLARRRFEASRSIISMLLAQRDQQNIDESTISSIESGQLSAPQARRLLSILRARSDDTVQLRRVILQEFHDSTYPQLADPEAFFRQLMATHKGVNKEEEELPGSYDARQTAHEARDLIQEELRNAGLPYDKIQTPVATRVCAMAGTLPDDRSAGASGLKHEWEHFLFRLRMARIPNSFAYLAVLFPKEMPTLVEAYRRARVVHTLTMVELAAFVFRKEHGKVPGSLEELRAADLIDAVPADPFSHGSLRLDVGKRKVWSVGPDHSDDGGAGDLFGKSGTDIVAKLP